ncbi:MAG: hypothetical protein JSW41_04795 [Candidatus Aenigmatarchaeota archaeon]|nr:MAG: hypothetical protein JSW41_04795 [Candidatus Aenigmarchaeota archaeon]
MTEFLSAIEIGDNMREAALHRFNIPNCELTCSESCNQYERCMDQYVRRRMAETMRDTDENPE